MAQHFFDLSLGKPGSPPYYFSDSDNINYSNVDLITPTDAGCLIWRNSNTSAYDMYSSLSVNTTDNFELLYKFRSLRVNDSANSNQGTQITFLSNGSDSYYVLNCGTITASSNWLRLIRLRRLLSGSNTNLADSSTALSTEHTIDDHFLHSRLIRVRGTAQNFKARTWWEDEAEPGTWAIDYTDSDTTLSSGLVGIVTCGFTSSFLHQFVSVGTDGDAADAPTSLPGGNRMVAGTVVEPTGEGGDPLENVIVRCYHRNTGMLLGETLTNSLGAFTMSIPVIESELIYVVVIDNLGNTYNARIKDLIAPEPVE